MLKLGLWTNHFVATATHTTSKMNSFGASIVAEDCVVYLRHNECADDALQPTAVRPILVTL
jgi:hypothetical protein